jgi:ketosteroid isomerase-like protein
MVAEFDRCARESDLEAFLSYSMDDVVWMPPSEPVVVGKQAVREWYANFYGTFDIEMTHEVLETHTFGDVVIARGNASETLTPKAGGSSMSLGAKFLLVFRRQPDGSLKVWRAIANSNAPPPGS